MGQPNTRIFIQLPLRDRNLPLALLIFALLAIGIAVPCSGQNRVIPVRTAYSALSAGIGTLWLTHEDGYFRKHGLDSNLIYIRGGSTAVQALLAGEIQFGHLSPAPMMTAWVQGADFVWVGTTTHQMVFTLLADPAITKGPISKARKSASRASVRPAISPCARLWNSSAQPKRRDDGRAGRHSRNPRRHARRRGARPAFSRRRLQPRPATWVTARYLHIPDLGSEFTFSGIAAKTLFRAKPA